jgi:hypothetical protein
MVYVPDDDDLMMIYLIQKDSALLVAHLSVTMVSVGPIPPPPASSFQ